MNLNTIQKWYSGVAVVAIAGTAIFSSVVILSDRPSAQTSVAPGPTLPKLPPSVPMSQEFTVGVVVTEQNCPQPGGCIYKYTIEPKYIGVHPLPEKEFTVEYEVTGGHQPQPGKFTVHNGQAQFMKDVVLEGPPGAHLQAAVMRVIG